MIDKSVIGLTPADYLSDQPAQQKVIDTQGGMESLASYEDGGDDGIATAGEEFFGGGRSSIGSKSGSTSIVGASDGLGDAGVERPGTGSSLTDNISNNGSPLSKE